MQLVKIHALVFMSDSKFYLALKNQISCILHCNVCKQVYWTLQAQKRVEAKAVELNKSSPILPFVQNMMDRNPD